MLGVGLIWDDDDGLVSAVVLHDDVGGARLVSVAAAGEADGWSFSCDTWRTVPFPK